MSKKNYTYYELEVKMNNFNISKYQAIICKNMKRIRKQLCDENKIYYKNNNLKNPYTAQSISELLGISYEYYKRLESFDKSKPISLKLLFKVSLLLDADISEFLK